MILMPAATLKVRQCRENVKCPVLLSQSGKVKKPALQARASATVVQDNLEGYQSAEAARTAYSISICTW